MADERPSTGETTPDAHRPGEHRPGEHRPRVLLLSDDDVLTGTLWRTTLIAEQLVDHADVLQVTLTPGGLWPAGDAAVPVQHVGSAASLNMGEDTWRAHLTQKLDRVVGTFIPDLLVTDGVFPEDLLGRICDSAGISWVEIVSAADDRGLAADGSREVPGPVRQVRLGEAGGLGAEGTDLREAAGSGVPVVSTAPVVDASVAEAVVADAAGLGAGELVTAVLDVGGLRPGTAAAVEDWALEWFDAAEQSWHVVILDSPVARRPRPGVEHATGGCRAELLQNATVVISVPGYRPFTAWTAGGVPALWLTERPESSPGAARSSGGAPSPAAVRGSRRGGQVTRAAHAQEAGWGLHLELGGVAQKDEPHAALTDALGSLCDQASMARMRGALSSLQQHQQRAGGVSGAAQAAEALKAAL